MPRMVKNMLAKLRFYCDEEACDYSRQKNNDEQGLAYEAALKHLQKCEHRRHECELGCGLMLKHSEMEEHRAQCPHYITTCPDCELEYKPNSDQKHDCIKELQMRHNLVCKELISVQH